MALEFSSLDRPVTLTHLLQWWNHHQPQRLIIVGPSGSGKSTLCKQLSHHLGCDGQDLDDLYWLPNWQFRQDDELRLLIANFVSQERWVLCGNYNRTQDLSWPRADLIIWLDFDLPILLWRLLCRTLRRIYTQESVCNGNRENWYNSFFMPDSLFLWLISTHKPQRGRYQKRMTDPTQPPILALKTPHEVARFHQLLARL